MKISEMIAKLADLQEKHGDLECVRLDWTMAVQDHNGPEVRHRLVLRGREWKDRLWSKYAHKDRLQGDKVVLL